MIPQNNIQNPNDFVPEKMSNNTYRFDWEQNRIRGNVNALDALKQAVYLILNTERYQYPIYSWNYGVELLDLFGKPTSLVLPELKRRISEAILQDDRMISVYDFSFQKEKGSVRCTFVVQTIFGEFQQEKEVKISV